MALLAEGVATSGNTPVLVAIISAAGVIIPSVITALVRINRLATKADNLSLKTDNVAGQAANIQVQLNGQMERILAQLEAANARALAAEVELARYKTEAEMKERYHVEPNPPE